MTSRSHMLLLKCKGLFQSWELASIWKESTSGARRPKAPYGITDFYLLQRDWTEEMCHYIHMRTKWATSPQMRELGSPLWWNLNTEFSSDHHGQNTPKSPAQADVFLEAWLAETMSSARWNSKMFSKAHPFQDSPRACSGFKVSQQILPCASHLTRTETLKANYPLTKIGTGNRKH